MPTPDASRRNSLRSTGPKTPQGKAVSRFNALWHAGSARILLLPDESVHDFNRLQQAFLDRFQPVGPEEQFLVDRMLLAAWRLHRLAAMEARVVAYEASCVGKTTDALDIVRNFFARKNAPPRPDPQPPHEPQHDSVAIAFVRDSNNSRTLVKLSRWQAALERSYYRAFQQLQQLRQTRDT